MALHFVESAHSCLVELLDVICGHYTLTEAKIVCYALIREVGRVSGLQGACLHEWLALGLSKIKRPLSLSSIAAEK